MNLLHDAISRTGKLSIGLIVCFASSVGCVQSESIQDRGELCLQHAEAEDGEYEIVPDESLEVYVAICGQSNWESVETWCEAEVSGQEIIISSRFDYAEPAFGSTSTNLICHYHTASCELPPLSEGTYTVIHGDTEKELVVPSDSEHELDCAAIQGWF